MARGCSAQATLWYMVDAHDGRNTFTGHSRLLEKFLYKLLFLVTTVAGGRVAVIPHCSSAAARQTISLGDVNTTAGSTNLLHVHNNLLEPSSQNHSETPPLRSDLPELLVTSYPSPTKKAWASSLCATAGARDIEKCSRELETEPSVNVTRTPVRAKVVGILVQHLKDHLWLPGPVRGRQTGANLVAEDDRYQRYSILLSSYVKFVEAAGHRVIPIPADTSLDEYRKLFLSIDGLLLPGGSAAIHGAEAPYYKATKLFLDWAVEANESDRYFPVFAICLGFQAMLIWGGGDNFTYFKDEDYRNLDRTRRLQFLPAAKSSKLFGPDQESTAQKPSTAGRKRGSAQGGNAQRVTLPQTGTLPTQTSRIFLAGGGRTSYGMKAGVSPQQWDIGTALQGHKLRALEKGAAVITKSVIDKKTLVHLLESQETAYFHQTHRITRRDFERDTKLPQRFALLATVIVTKISSSQETPNPEDEFAAVVESTRYPFYGFQFHPEKNLFEHSPFSNIPHDPFSRWVANSFSVFFGNEVGKSTRKSTRFAEEWLHLIERFAPTDLSSPYAAYEFEEAYIFGGESGDRHETAHVHAAA